MDLYGKNAPEMAVAGDLLATRLGELLVSKGVITSAEAASVIEAARKDAMGPRGWPTGSKAAEIIEEVGRIWGQAKG